LKAIERRSRSSCSNFAFASVAAVSSATPSACASSVDSVCPMVVVPISTSSSTGIRRAVSLRCPQKALNF